MGSKGRRKISLPKCLEGYFNWSMFRVDRTGSWIGSALHAISISLTDYSMNNFRPKVLNPHSTNARYSAQVVISKAQFLFLYSLLWN